MLCHAASTSCTYIAPTAITINPKDPTWWAEPCRTARAPSVKTARLFRQTCCESEIGGLDNQILVCQERLRNKHHLLYSVKFYPRSVCTEDLFFFFFVQINPQYSAVRLLLSLGQMVSVQLCIGQHPSLTTLLLKSFATVFEGLSVSLANELTVVKIRFNLSRLCLCGEHASNLSGNKLQRGRLGLNIRIIQQ